MTWKTDEPFLLKPAFKDYLWGGDRLRSEYHKETDLSPLAESWECSTHPDGTSLALIDQNEIPMTEVLKRHPEILGTHPRTRDTLPILIKLIDAKKDLSVQVHPDDDYACKPGLWLFSGRNRKTGQTGDCRWHDPEIPAESTCEKK